MSVNVEQRTKEKRMKTRKGKKKKRKRKKEINRRLAFSTSSYSPFLLSSVKKKRKKKNIFRSMNVVNVCAHLDPFRRTSIRGSTDRWIDARGYAQAREITRMRARLRASARGHAWTRIGSARAAWPILTMLNKSSIIISYDRFVIGISVTDV